LQRKNRITERIDGTAINSPSNDALLHRLKTTKGRIMSKMSTDDSGGRSLITPPKTPAQFKPAKPSSMTAEMAALMRNQDHWAEIYPYLDAIAGTGPSIHGSARYDEAGCIFKVQEICGANGYTLLAAADAAHLSRYFKFALKSNTGLTMKVLLKQRTQLRLEHRRAAE
jgi:hypothetical protein